MQGHETDKVREVLAKLKRIFGGVPEVFNVMTRSQELLTAAEFMRESLSEVELSPIEKEILIYYFSFRNQSAFCMDIHHEILNLNGFDFKKATTEEDFFKIEDPKFLALVKFAKEVYDNRGQVDPKKKDEFLKAGYTDKTVLEVLLISTFSYCVNTTSRHFDLMYCE